MKNATIYAAHTIGRNAWLGYATLGRSAAGVIGRFALESMNSSIMLGPPAGSAALVQYFCGGSALCSRHPACCGYAQIKNAVAVRYSAHALQGFQTVWQGREPDRHQRRFAQDRKGLGQTDAGQTWVVQSRWPTCAGHADWVNRSR